MENPFLYLTFTWVVWWKPDFLKELGPGEWSAMQLDTSWLKQLEKCTLFHPHPSAQSWHLYRWQELFWLVSGSINHFTPIAHQQVAKVTWLNWARALSQNSTRRLYTPKTMLLLCSLPPQCGAWLLGSLLKLMFPPLLGHNCFASPSTTYCASLTR